MKNLFNFGKRAKVDEQIQNNYDFVETPEVFRDIKEAVSPVEETNLLKMHLNKPVEEEVTKNFIRTSPSPFDNSYKVSFKGSQDSGELDEMEYEPLETEIEELTESIDDLTVNEFEDIDVGEFESLEQEIAEPDFEEADLEGMTAEEFGRELLGAEPMPEMNREIVELDLTGDEMTDVLGMDWDESGTLDAVAWDSNIDGQVDTLVEDLDLNGTYETVLQDSDFSGRADKMSIDTNDDGIEDITIDLE